MAQWPRIRLPVQETQMWVWFLGWLRPWRRKWQPIPVFLPGKFHGQRSLVGYIVHGVQRDRHDWAHTHTYTGSQDPKRATKTRHSQIIKYIFKKFCKCHLCINTCTEIYIHNFSKGYWGNVVFLRMHVGNLKMFYCFKVTKRQMRL